MSDAEIRPAQRTYVLTDAGYDVLRQDEAAVLISVRRIRGRTPYVLTDYGRAALDDSDDAEQAII